MRRANSGPAKIRSCSESGLSWYAERHSVMAALTQQLRLLQKLVVPAAVRTAGTKIIFTGSRQLRFCVDHLCGIIMHGLP